ncbi:MAG: ABC transporter ATP-binding protein [Actinobacteria bacterium]|nr:ABC transporter ATP-binding protein [Actinomycetota bacterium]
MSRPAIVCREVRKRYGSVEALRGVSLEIAEGSVFGFLGPNGAGKSTLVKILTGLIPRAEGEVRVLGGRPGERAVQRRVGYLPELFRFPPWLTGAELLRFHGRLAGVPVNTRALLDLVGIGAAGDRRVGTYSKGMQQRLGLAQALVGDPDLVFLDEPTSALDPLGRLDVRDVLVHLRGRGVTVFLNSHLLTEVEKVCDRVAVIDSGTLVAEGTMDQLLQKPNVRIRVGALDAAAVEHLLVVLAAPGARFADGVVTVPVASAEEVPRLVRTAVESGAPVYEVSLERRSLEEAFVHLVRERQDKEEPAAPPPHGGGAA